MRRARVIAGALWLCGCVRGEPPPEPAGAGARAEGPGEAAVSSVKNQAGEATAAPNGEELPPQQRGADGRCEPMPKTGDPCRAGDGYCVLSWGEPGGYSEALWCREGRWQLEQERNLP